MTRLDDLSFLFKEMSKGMFDTDRVSLDKRFSVEIATNRYKNWIASAFKDGSFVCQVLLKSEAISFFVVKKEFDQVYRGLLTGVYEKFRSSGYGILIMDQLKKFIWDKGVNSI